MAMERGIQETMGEEATQEAEQVMAPREAMSGTNTGEEAELETDGLGVLFGDMAPMAGQDLRGESEDQPTEVLAEERMRGAAAPATLGWRADNTADWADRWKQRERAKKASLKDPFWNQSGGRLWQREGAPCGMGRPIAGEEVKEREFSDGGERRRSPRKHRPVCTDQKKQGRVKQDRTDDLATDRKKTLESDPFSGPYLGNRGKPVSKPTKYDGSTDLTDYLNHFDLCIGLNGWGPEEAGMFLGLSLAGPARRLLTGRKPATREGYEDLRRALIERFEPTNQEETYKAFLRTRQRRENEGLQALQEELMKYTRLAYPEADAKTTDTLVLDRFLMCLDPRLRQWVYQSSPKNLQAAVMTAVGAEAYLKNDAEPSTKVRAADATVNERLSTNNDRMDRLALAVEALLRREERSTGVQGTGKRRVASSACYGCGQEGHFKRECPNPATQGATTGRTPSEPPKPITGGVTTTASGN